LSISNNNARLYSTIAVSDGIEKDLCSEGYKVIETGMRHIHPSLYGSYAYRLS